MPSFKPAATASAANAVTADTGVTIHRVALGAVIAAGTAAFAWSLAELIQHPVSGSTWFVLLGLTIDVEQQFPCDLFFQPARPERRSQPLTYRREPAHSGLRDHQIDGV